MGVLPRPKPDSRNPAPHRANESVGRNIVDSCLEDFVPHTLADAVGLPVSSGGLLNGRSTRTRTSREVPTVWSTKSQSVTHRQSLGHCPRITIRSLRCSASSKWCVVNKIDVPVCIQFVQHLKDSLAALRIDPDRRFVQQQDLRSCMTPQARLIRRFMPPEKLPTNSSLGSPILSTSMPRQSGHGAVYERGRRTCRKSSDFLVWSDRRTSAIS